MSNHKNFQLQVSVSLNDESDLSSVSSECEYFVSHSNLIEKTELLGEQDESILGINVTILEPLPENDIADLVAEMEVSIDHDSVDSVDVSGYTLELAL